ncbi:MAG: hypothetical protein KGL94_10325 [Acidobacteriota bacterium]|nr:hypothetical protein [Acidobacteriota bacterium]
MATMIKRLALAFALGACVAAVSAPAGSAGLLTCPANQQPFAQFGDYNDYFGFANNGFENGTSGWSVSGSTVVTGNEPWGVNGSGSSSLSIGPGGTASSPRVCTALLAPDWRMFAKANGANGSLRAQIVFYGLLGNVTGILNVTSFGPAGYAAWEPTADVPSLLSLPLATVSAQLRLTNTGSSGTWQVDDVFVDPWLSRNAG